MDLRRVIALALALVFFACGNDGDPTNTGQRLGDSTTGADGDADTNVIADDELADFDVGPDDEPAGDEGDADDDMRSDDEPVGDDADGDANQVVDEDPPEVCVPMSTEACYDGPVATRDVGPCSAGERTCNEDGSAYGPCVDQTLPATHDVCGDGIDNDCNGTPDDSIDADGDGWAVCDGDCCDSASDGCVDPLGVNPGAFDFAGDEFDDDCNDIVDDGPTTFCDSSLASNSSEPADYAAALDICVTTPLAPHAVRERGWGLIAARLTRSSGSGSPNASGHAIRPSFGQIEPRTGSALGVLSTGTAAAANQTNPAFSAPQPGFAHSTTSTPPADWYAARSDTIPAAPGCPAPSGAVANDSVMLELTLRVPTNARSFSLAGYFLSAEYPEWVCSSYNDVFVALLESQATGNPGDKNLAFYVPTGESAYYPLNVNLARDTGLFTACKNGTIGCNAVESATSACISTSDLAGTGLDITSTGCGLNDLVGGGTGWLTISGNVVPGETIVLRLGIWDSGDDQIDSTVLLDDLRWSDQPTSAGITSP